MSKISGLCFLLFLMSCATQSEQSSSGESDSTRVRLITLDPGHFHAALVQKSEFENVDSTVHVYAPEGPDLRPASRER